MALSDGGAWNRAEIPISGDGALVPQLQPCFAPSEGEGNSLLGDLMSLPGKYEGRNVAPRPQKVGKREWSSISPPYLCKQRFCGWIQPCLGVLFSPEKALGLWKITSPNHHCSFTTGRSCKNQMGTTCVTEGKCGESRENPSAGGLWQPGKQLQSAFGMCFLQLRGWKISRRGQSSGNHLPAPSSKP